MANVKCIGQVIRKSDNSVKMQFSGKTITNVSGYQSVLRRAEEVVEEYNPRDYEVKIICKVEKDW